jgi:hypothetical protein
MRVRVYEAGQYCTASRIQAAFLWICSQQFLGRTNSQDGSLPDQHGPIFKDAQAAEGLPALRTAG